MTETTFKEPILITQGERKEHCHSRLDMVILEGVDEGLASFGELFKQAFYTQLQKNYQIEKQEIPFRIDEFVMAMQEMLGMGARMIEAKIMEALHGKAGGFLYVPKSEEFTFTDYVHKISRFLENAVTP